MLCERKCDGVEAALVAGPSVQQCQPGGTAASRRQTGRKAPRRAAAARLVVGGGSGLQAVCAQQGLHLGDGFDQLLLALLQREQRLLHLSQAGLRLD